MITYLLKSASCLALLLFFYHFILEKEKMHQFNRFYLLGSVLFSFFVPLATITIPSAPEIVEAVQHFNQPTFIEDTAVIITKEPFNYTQLFIGIYFLISSIFSIRFGKNLFKIIQKIKLNEKVKHQKAILVLVHDKILPHTFWNYIFINKKEYKQNEIEEELFTHELTHVTQKHTLDVLLIELLQIIFWINPLFIFLKKAIQLNHEFLADQKVIHQHKNTFQYQHLLLNKAAWNNEYYLASNLNYSLTKKRLKMMTTQSSNIKILLKKMAILPLLIGFVFLFANKVEAQEIITITEDKKPTNEVKNKTEQELYKEYYFRNGRVSSKDKNGKRILKNFTDLTEIEKQKFSSPPPLVQKKKIPTKKQLNTWKNNSKYAIWIDGKVVKNTILNKYKNTDFSSFFDSFVYKNARSKRFPQTHQVSISTNAYFKKQNENNHRGFEKYKEKYKIYPLKKALKNSVNVISSSYPPKFYKNWFITIRGEKYYYAKTNGVWNYYKNKKRAHLNIIKEYNKKHITYEKLQKTGKHYVFKNVIDKKRLDKLFSDLGGIYFRMPRAKKNQVSYPNSASKPYITLWKNGKKFYKKRSELTSEDKLLMLPPPSAPNASKEEQKEWKKVKKILSNSTSKKATKEQLGIYNFLAKKYNKQPKETRIVKLKDLKRLEYLYAKLSKKQKKNAQPFPECIPPPPLPHKILKTDVAPPLPPKNNIGNAKNLKVSYQKEKKNDTIFKPHIKRKLISQKEMELIKPDEIESINITKEGKQNGTIFINLKKNNKNRYLYLKAPLTTKLNTKNLGSVKYYLDNKFISKKEIELINPNKIAAVRIKKNKDGSKSMYITSRKK